MNRKVLNRAIVTAALLCAANMVLEPAFGQGYILDYCEDFANGVLVLEDWSENAPVATPTVIHDASGYEMWYNSHFIPGRAGIFHATSPNGTDWTETGPVLVPGAAGWEAIHLYNCSVMKEESVYKMWYTGYGGANDRIGYATSSDGINWTKYSGNPVVELGAWDSRVVRVGSVLFDSADGLYRMWYTGGSGWFHPLQVGYATSPDGITWAKHPSPVFTFGSTTEWINNHVNVILHNGIYQMYFSSETRDIRHATSLDGINWTLNDCGPVYEPPVTGWDSAAVGGACVLRENGVRKLWYEGNDGTRSALGYAHECDITAGTSEDCNANGIPDECDIAGGTSKDCNENGIPDECELISEECPYQRGDVNNDGEINRHDVMHFMLVLVGLDHCACSVAAADVNGDGVVDHWDVRPFMRLLRCNLGHHWRNTDVYDPITALIIFANELGVELDLSVILEEKAEWLEPAETGPADRR